MNQHDQILDKDGENQAVRCFLLHYQNPGVSIGALRNALRRSGFEGCWPDWVNGKETSESITKAGAQIWIRHLFALEKRGLIRWESIETAPCDDDLYLLWDGKYGQPQVVDLDHDSDPQYWKDRGFTHWAKINSPESKL